MKNKKGNSPLKCAYNELFDPLKRAENEIFLLPTLFPGTSNVMDSYFFPKVKGVAREGRRHPSHHVRFLLLQTEDCMKRNPEGIELKNCGHF